MRRDALHEIFLTSPTEHEPFSPQGAQQSPARAIDLLGSTLFIGVPHPFTAYSDRFVFAAILEAERYTRSGCWTDQDEIKRAFAGR
jgi:hypothetical protein